MDDHIRWGILGNANIARKALIPAIGHAQNAELTAIASGSGQAKDTAEAFHIAKAYDSYEALLKDPEVDAVYIPLPNGLHAEWVRKAAEAGKHVLCEKPAALTAAETEQMIAVCREHEVLFMEAFMYQFHPQHDKVKELIASGEIGEVKLLRSRFSFPLHDRQNVRFDRALGGGCLYDVGCYCIHAFRHILEQEPHKAYAQAHHDAATGVDVTTTGLLTFADDVQASFDASFETQAQEMVEVNGDKGRIEVHTPFRPDKNAGGHGEVTVERNDGTTTTFQIAGAPYTLQVEHFSRCISRGTTPRYSPAATIKNMKVIDAIYEAIYRRQPVTLG